MLLSLRTRLIYLLLGSVLIAAVGFANSITETMLSQFEDLEQLPFGSSDFAKVESKSDEYQLRLRSLGIELDRASDDALVVTSDGVLITQSLEAHTKLLEHLPVRLGLVHGL